MPNRLCVFKKLSLSLFLAIIFVVASPSVVKADSEWNMGGANPQRTSWVDVDVGSVDGIEWYRPIEPYIMQHTQIITANKKIYVSTSKGLLVMDAEDGELIWRFNTEMPLAHSPVVIGDMVYVGGMDRKFYALQDLGNSYSVEWVFTQAGAGYSDSPLVEENTVYIGNRDGYFYAINVADGTLRWRYPGTGQEPLNPIINGAAYNNNTVYFSSHNNYAYALNADTGALVWQSAERLHGERSQGFWPVIFGDKVVFSTALGYKRNASPGGNSIDYYDDIYGTDELVTMLIGDRHYSDGTDGWATGTALLDSQSNTGGFTTISSYLTTYPERRPTVVLDASTGTETTVAPFVYSGTGFQQRYPPIISPDGSELYLTNGYMRSAGNGISRAAIMGWKLGNQYLKVPDAHATNYENDPNTTVTYAIDEPSALSGSGTDIFINLNSDRIAGNITDRTMFWNYPSTLDGYIPSQIVDSGNGPVYTPNNPGRYDTMWQLISNTLERLQAYFKGNSNSINGTYSNHGVQNPLIPYIFTNSEGQTVYRMFTHRSNTIIALGTTGSETPLSLIPLENIPDAQAEASTLATSELTDRLETEINKMVTVWEDSAVNVPDRDFLNPGYYNQGQFAAYAGFTEYYFVNPADSLLPLSLAYHKIEDSALKTRLASYLDAFVQRFYVNNLVKSIGYTGTPRESMAYPPEVLAEMSSISDSTAGTFSMRNFYAMSKYIDTLPAENQTATALSLYTATKTLVSTNTNPLGGIGWTQEDWHKRRVWEVNEYIMGLNGFLALQSAAYDGNVPVGEQTRKTNAENALTELNTLVSTTFYKDHSVLGEYDNPTGYNENQIYRFFNLSRNFMFVTPEQGSVMNQGSVSAAVDEYTYVGPLWFMSMLDNHIKEGVMNHLYDRFAVFNAKATLLNDSREELSKYVDIPAFTYGDMHYISILTMALDATPESAFITGDINTDGTVNLLDYIILSNNFGTGHTSSDLNSDGTVNLLDYIILSNNFGLSG